MCEYYEINAKQYAEATFLQICQNNIKDFFLC